MLLSTSSLTPRRMLTAITVALIFALLLLTGCTPHAPGEIGRLQKLAETCPNAPVNSQVQYDGTGSSATDDIYQERMALIESVAERTAICSGTLTITVFSSSSGATTTVFADDMPISAPTKNAHLRRVPEAVEAVMAEISAVLPSAIGSLPGGGSDITASYRLMGEHAAQFPGSRLESYLLTDGLSNVSIQIDGSLTPESAVALAAQVPVPSLPADSVIVVSGLGRVAGDPVPSSVIEGMVAFYNELCARTGAAECHSVTDWR